MTDRAALPDPAVIQATFADVRPISTRKVLRLMFEIPIEAADHAIKALGGFPRPDESRWVAIALLVPDKVTPETRPPATVPPPRSRWPEMPLPQRAGLLCKSPGFWTFLGTEGEAEAAMALRQRCGVVSRQELKPGALCGEIYLRTEADYFATLDKQGDPRTEAP